MKYIFWLTFFLFFESHSFAQNRILIDDDFADWQGIQPAFVDAMGDAAGIDFESLSRFVGHFDSDGILAGNGCHDADAGHA